VDNSLIVTALMTALLPLVGALLAGLLGKKLGTVTTHRIVIALVGISFLLSCYLFKVIVLDGEPAAEASLYTWATAGTLKLDVALLLDRLSETMCLIVLFVSLMVRTFPYA
jgi:NADH-quinone oxidoreductase subunit L